MKRLAAVAVLLAALIVAAPHLEHASAGVLAALDGNPATPQPFSQHPEYAAYDVQVHQRGPGWPAMSGQHGADCAGPPATHQVTSFDGAVFICKDHLMTSLNGDEYGVIYLTPNRLLNLASGSVTFDLSTERQSQRDWWDILISPWSEQMALPLLSDLSQGVDLQGHPRNAISIATDNGQTAPNLKVVRNGAVQRYGQGPGLAQGIASGTNQAAVRQSFKFSAQNGRMRFERLASPTAPALVYFDVAATAAFTSGIVQFGHHSYDPTKDGSGVPATWHWDNLAVNNGTPFTVQHAAPRQLTSPGTVTFPAAPTGAFLRFSSLCRPVVNGVAATYQPAVGSGNHAPEHASSYWVPIPAGSTSASLGFTNDDWYGPGGFACIARDFHVWAAGGGAPQPTATNTPTLAPPTATATLIPTATTGPPTATLIPPTATQVPPTGTPIPPTATVTLTPPPVVYRCVRLDDSGPVTVWEMAGGGACP